MKPTLGQVFVLSLLGLIAMLALLFAFVVGSSQATLIESSERIRDRASRQIVERVTSFLSVAPDAASQFRREVEHGLVDPTAPPSVEASLIAMLLANDNLGEVTFTYASQTGFAPDGSIQLAEAPRGQITAVRTPGPDGKDRIWSRHIHQEDGRFVEERRDLSAGDSFSAAPVQRVTSSSAADPTDHPTFSTPAEKDLFGQLLWSDLHWSQLDVALPEAQRRVEVSVQQVVIGPAGPFAGVIRVGLLTHQLDRAVEAALGPAGAPDPHRTFICDAAGRLVTRLDPASRIVEAEDDLRVSPAGLPPEVAAALADPRLRALRPGAPGTSWPFMDDGREYLATFRPLSDTQEWIVGVVVPQAFYLGRLIALRDRLLAMSLGMIVVLVGVGSLVLRGVKRAQAQIEKESLRMNAFEFSPAPVVSAFRDVGEVLESLEKAKTAMRAMGKYVPIDLVRRLYCQKREPMLGSELMEISIMFTDIKDFTTLAEGLEPNRLADALGQYLGVMARIIQQDTRGTIDKFIGDAIMTFWNAPEPVPDHGVMACLAAIRCRDAGRALAGSPEWGGQPAFVTRFGLHLAPALVGHFGAPDRMNYTAIGDAINLGARLEGLNKQYGTTIIASERIVESARGRFEFRLLDWVAVKGKSEAIRIYELLGEAGNPGHDRVMVAAYEHAFEAYVTRDFQRTITLLEPYRSDGPSAVLLERCRIFLADPPPPEWKGIYAATAK